MIFRSRNFNIKKFSKIEELKGSLQQSEEKKLMSSVLKHDKTSIDEGRIIQDSINQGLFSFNPDILFENLVKNYGMAKQIYGESFLREITGEDESSLKRNLKIPEFQRKIKKKIQDNIDKLKEKNLVNKDLEISEKGLYLAALSLYIEELDDLVAKGLIGEKVNEKLSLYGSPVDFRNYKKGDRYKDIALKKSIKLAIRRQHKNLEKPDLVTLKRESKGKICIVYGLDASGSMKGEKIKLCKKAGIALAFKAINEKDKVGLIVFGSEIENIVRPCSDFFGLLKEISKARAKKETNIALTIKKSIELFPSENITKHLILISDALPTVGEEPEKETLEAVNLAISSGITISFIGVNLNEKGKELAEKISQIGKGRLHIVKNLKNLDRIVLEDYYLL